MAQTDTDGRYVSRTDLVAVEDAGYHHSLTNRQIQMIAMGGAIGTGLFLGAGSRLHDAGPSLAVVYAVSGLFAFPVVRAMGELVVHRPSSGSFVSYSREFLGEPAAYLAGWMYFLNWAVRHRRRHGRRDLRQVLRARAAPVDSGADRAGRGAGGEPGLGRPFGELEFWFAVIKIAALVIFLLIGIGVLASRHQIGGHDTGPPAGAPLAGPRTGCRSRPRPTTSRSPSWSACTR